MPSAFIPNPAGIFQLAREITMAQAMGEIAEEGANRARDIGPSDEGDYVESIDSGWDIDADGAFGRIFATDYKANWIEFGTEDTPIFAPLRKAVESLGLTISATEDMP